jgi:hypothetical protein
LTDALGNILYENQPVQFNETGLRDVTKIADGKFFRPLTLNRWKKFLTTSTSWRSRP